MTPEAIEIDAIEKRYERRFARRIADRYSPLDPYVMMAEQEKDRALIRLLKQVGVAGGISRRMLLELGCGNGSNLMRFMRVGFRPENIVGNELLPQRVCEARAMLPESVELLQGDALQLDRSNESFDVVVLFTVLSSILDDGFQQRLAAKAWSLVKPGGGVLCYDFTYNNPANPDVRGVPMRRLRELFPGATIRWQRVTLAPPLGRPLARLHAALYTIANSAWPLRSHVLAWLSKTRG